MQINSLSQINFNKIQAPTPAKISYLSKANTGDTVSFSGSRKILTGNPLKSSNLGLNLYNEILDKEVTYQDVEKIFNNYAQEIKIKPMSQLDKININPKDYVAFQCSVINDDFTYSDRTIYLDLPKKNADNMSKMLFAMETAHEFTHVLQGDAPENTVFLKEMAKGDIEYLKLIRGCTEELFKPFDTTMQHETIKSIITPADKMKILQYKKIVPRKCNINEQMIYKALKVKNKKEFDELINAVFNSNFKEVLNIITKNEEFLNALPENLSAEEFYTAIKKSCADMAKNEKEANEAESRIAKKILRTSSDLNIDITSKYYEMVAEALSKNSELSCLKRP